MMNITVDCFLELALLKFMIMVVSILFVGFPGYAMTFRNLRSFGRFPTAKRKTIRFTWLFSGAALGTIQISIMVSHFFRLIENLSGGQNFCGSREALAQWLMGYSFLLTIPATIILMIGLLGWLIRAVYLKHRSG